MTRTHSEKKNSLYLTSSLVKELTLRNEKRCKVRKKNETNNIYQVNRFTINVSCLLLNVGFMS